MTKRQWIWLIIALVVFAAVGLYSAWQTNRTITNVFDTFQAGFLEAAPTPSFPDDDFIIHQKNLHHRRHSFCGCSAAYQFLFLFLSFFPTVLRQNHMLHQITDAAVRPHAAVVQTKECVVVGAMHLKGPIPSDLAGMKSKGLRRHLIPGFPTERLQRHIPVADDWILLVFMQIQLLNLPCTVGLR